MEHATQNSNVVMVQTDNICIRYKDMI